MTLESSLDPGDLSLVEALRKLGFALRSRRMYPESSPVLQRARTAAAAALRDALDGQALILDVLPQELRWQGARGEMVLEPQQEIASRLHRHQLARLRIEPGFTDEDLDRFLTSILVDPEAVTGQHPLLLQEIPGFAGESLDLGSLYRDGGEAIGRDSLWDHVLDGFVAAGNGGPMEWRDLAEQPENLARLLRWSLDPAQQPASLTPYSQTDVFGLICEQVAAASEMTPEQTLEAVAEAVALVQRAVDPEVWLELLAEPLNVALGQGADRVHVDLAAVISRSLSAAQLQELVSYSVRSRQHATPRLYRFFQRALGDRPDQKAIARRVLQANPQSRTAEFADAWPGFMDALLGEDITPYVKADYRTAIDQALGGRGIQNAWDVDAIRRRLGEMEPDYMRLAMARVAHALLSRERDDGDYRLLLGGVLRGLDAIVRRQDVDLLEAITSTLARHAHDLDRSQAVRAAAAEGLDRLRAPAFLRGMVALLGHGDGHHFHALWRVIDLLGSGCLPFVLGAMADNPSPAYRHHVARILQQTPEVPVELFVTELQDPRAPYVRDLVLVLSESGREESLPLLETALTHADAMVRRTALVGLTRFPPERVEPHLVEALSDPALEVRVAAMRGFRDLYADRSQEHLVKYLRLPNWTGRNTRVITAAIKALAGLGDQHALADLQRLSRRPLIFRRRRMAVAFAAREAITLIRRRLDASLQQEPAASTDSSEALAA